MQYNKGQRSVNEKMGDKLHRRASQTTIYMGPCEKKHENMTTQNNGTRGRATKKNKLTRACMIEFVRTLKQTNQIVIDLDELKTHQD
jgi:hypothetical protein